MKKFLFWGALGYGLYWWLSKTPKVAPPVVSPADVPASDATLPPVPDPETVEGFGRYVRTR